MKHLAAAAAVFLLTSSAVSAQSAASKEALPPGGEEIRDACVFVAKNLLMVRDLKLGVVQAFPELEPPGARLTYSTRMDVEDAEITDEMECEFTRNDGKLTVLKFCADSTCYTSDSEDADNRRRFEEMRALFARSR